jgi:glucose 1-dehydrogenase
MRGDEGSLIANKCRSWKLEPTRSDGKLLSLQVGPNDQQQRSVIKQQVYMSTNRGIVYVPGQGTVEYAELPDVEPGPGQVKIKILGIGICKTDWDRVLGSGWGTQNKTVMGHETYGRVVAVGADVERFKVGDPVVPTVRRPKSQSCSFQANGLLHRAYPGEYTESGIFERPGFGQNYIVEDEAFVLHLDPRLAELGVGSFVEPGSISFRAVSEIYELKGSIAGTIWIERTKLVAVLGSGMIGLTSVIAAKQHPLHLAVFMFGRKGPDSEKARLCTLAGGRYVQLLPEDLTHPNGARNALERYFHENRGDGQVQELAKHFKHSGGIDLVIEGTGDAMSYIHGVYLMGNDGGFAVTSIPSQVEKLNVTIDLNVLMTKMVLLNGCSVGMVNSSAQHFVGANQMLANAPTSLLKGLVSHAIPSFECVDEINAVLKEEPSKYIKVVIHSGDEVAAAA